MQFAILFGLIVGILTLVLAGLLTVWVLKQPKGSKKMEEIANAIQEGAKAYLYRQYKTLSIFVIILALIIGFALSWSMAITFVIGVILSGLAGYIGMTVSVRANIRTAQAAESGLMSAGRVAIRSGAVTGLALVGLGLLGICVLYLIFQNFNILLGFGFGASLMSLFARVGGGIYTKAADVGADIVGKVEAGIPEDDPRNPAVIADNVGDNVGDCAGMAADLFESFVVTILAAMVLGVSLGIEYALLPLSIAAMTTIASIVGILFTRIKNENKLVRQLYYGLFIAVILGIVLTFFITKANMGVFWAYVVGAVATVLIGLITEYYTDGNYKPVKDIAEVSKTGAGTNVIRGLGVGFVSTALPMILVVVAIAISYVLGGFYGIAIASVAMLSFTSFIITLDAYGPITDNAGGIAEMSGMNEKVRKVTDSLDAAGNTTKATTKGFAVVGAALGALVLFTAFAEAVGITTVNLLTPAVTIGLFIGALLPFVFSSFLMNAVGKAAMEIVEEVRRQFREIKGLMQGKAKPDYAKCVDISTKAAQKELLIPGLIAVVSPILVGFLFGVEAVAGLLAGAIASGFLLAITMCTAGAAWDNAKKTIESKKLFGGKGSDAHKCAVVGDMVGDPFKDTAGPALNSLIKVLSTVALVFATVITVITIGLL